jgi:hypothetical protein
MEVEAQQTEGATELAFAHLRNAVAHHDQEAVASISYRLLTAGHEFGAILEEVVSAGDVAQTNTNDRDRNNGASLHRHRYACFVLSGLLAVLPTPAFQMVSRPQAVSENKVALNNKVQRGAEVPNWARYVRRDVTEPVAEGIRTSEALTINADQGVLSASQGNPSEKQLAVQETAPEKPPEETAKAVPPVHPPVDVGALREPPSLVEVQSTNSNKPGAEGSVADLQSYISRGNALFTAGDVAGARVFYRRAAEYQSATAAERLGETYDPRFLAQAGLPQLLGDEKTARFWYSRAHDLRDQNR